MLQACKACYNQGFGVLPWRGIPRGGCRTGTGQAKKAITLILPYEDEDRTMEGRILLEMDREKVMNECIRHSSRIEDQFGLTILTRLKAD